MPDKTPCLCLISSAPVSDLSHIQKIFEALGYRVVSMVLPDPAGPQAESTIRSVPGEVSGLVLLDEPASYVETFYAKWHSLSHPLRNQPVFNVYRSELPATKFEGDQPAPFDDFFSLKETPAAIGLRLKVRRADSGKWGAAQRLAQEQATQLATLDTAIKQREEFLGVCAHDLRSPLGLIQTCLGMVLQSPEALSALKPNLSQLLARAHRQAGHALSLVKDLLDVMALEQGLKPHYQLLTIHDLLSCFQSDYRIQADQKKIQLHYVNPIPEWRVLADPERIQQLLENLLGNALKFTEAGKNIYLSVAPFQGRRKTDPPYPMMIISLKDEGKGIPQSEVEKIFDRFVQLKEHAREGGRGLGLTVAKQISSLHDGNLWVQSVEGSGSTFFVLFPHVINRAKAPNKSNDIRRLLIAEPSREKRESVFKKLSDWGYHVDFASDGIEAITRLFHFWPDALIVTPELGKIRTNEVVNLLKSDSLASQIPLIFAAGQAAQRAQKESVLADAFLPMPFAETDWIGALAQCRNRVLKKAA